MRADMAGDVLAENGLDWIEKVNRGRHSTDPGRSLFLGKTQKVEVSLS